MNKKALLLIMIPILLVIIGFVVVQAFAGSNIAVLNPKGTIAAEQRDLLVIATLLMLIVVLPVFALTFYIPWKFRAGNTKAKYTPDWDHNKLLESAWWGIPFAIILVLSVITWKSSHELDPYRPLASDEQPVLVEAVALDWKWLFIYPEYNIASVNFLQFPEDRPVNFKVTADAPMNSLWIPQLGGQVYAMSGMTTKLHLIADEAGDYSGSSANLSGEGFAGMRFIARASTQQDFDVWIRTAQESPNVLDAEEYASLVKPSKSVAPIQFSLAEDDLYTMIVMKYMSPHTTGHSTTQNGSEIISAGHDH